MICGIYTIDKKDDQRRKKMMVCICSIELRDTGLYGFILPPEQIIATAEEAWAFHKVAF